MNKEQVLTKLRSINYPGFSRDIVSFGMVKDIEINDESIKLELNITSQNEEKKQQVIENVKKAFSSGCNLVLHCNGNIKEMRQLARISPKVDKFIIKKTSEFYKLLS